MRRSIGLAAVAVLVGLTGIGQAQMGGTSRGNGPRFGNAGADASKGSITVPVTITSGDDKSTTGTLRLTTVVIACSFGVYEIKPDKVQEIRLNPTSASEPTLLGPTGMQKAGSIITVTGQTIDGTILIPAWWRVETELGTLALNSEELRSIQFNSVRPGELAPNPASGANAPQIQTQVDPLPAPGQVRASFRPRAR